MSIDASGAIARLREVDARSGGQRVAWSDCWADERDSFVATARALVPGLVVERDPFANLWLVLPGRSHETVLLGSHSDCVPGGGWLDGILGVHAGLAVLAALAAAGGAERTVALVDWADEEGSRFGRSLLGSSAATGALPRAVLDALRDADGNAAGPALGAHGFDPARLGERSPRLRDVVAALELHVEQGPVLEQQRRARAAVAGCLGVRRTTWEVTGAAGHAGATPMRARRDPVRAASEAVAAVHLAAEQTGGLATVGRIAAEPAIVTAVAERCRFTLDLRHARPAPLHELDRQVRRLVQEAAAERGCRATCRPLWEIEPIAFEEGLVAAAVAATGGGAPVVSGPLHDSAALALAGIPAVMLFAPSIGGVSHTRAENTAEPDLVAAIEAFHALARQLAT